MRVFKSKVLCLFILLQLTLIFYLPSSVSAKKDVLLSQVDFKTIIDRDRGPVCNVKTGGWDPTGVGGYYGGRQGESCLVRGEKEDKYAEAFFTLSTPQGAAKVIEIEHLDGYADDSFDIFVMHANGEWIKAGSYSDLGNEVEKWDTHTFDLSKVTIAKGRNILVMIRATGEDWGQIAIDKMMLWGNGKPKKVNDVSKSEYRLYRKQSKGKRISCYSK